MTAQRANRATQTMKNMNYKQNLHIHTKYSDGRDTPEEMIAEAIARGFSSIGFSEHSYMSFSSYKDQMTEEKAVAYREEIRALKARYKGTIDLFCGLELEFYSDVSTADYDYLIGSVHYLHLNGELLGFDRNLSATQAYLADNFGGDGMKFAEKYFETVSLLPQRKVDIVGHFDLLTKNNEQGRFIDVTSKKYLGYGYEAIRALQGKIPFFEVNTGAIARGYRTSPYPQTEFLKEFRRLGFGAVVTSDCHDKNFIDCYYPEAEALLRAAGFTSKWILTDDGFQEVAL